MSAVIYVVSRRKQVCRFRHSISCVAFNRFIIEKAPSHISNMGSTSSAKSLLSGGIARLPPPRLWTWLPFIYFKIGSLEFPWHFPYVFS